MARGRQSSKGKEPVPQPKPNQNRKKPSTASNRKRNVENQGCRVTTKKVRKSQDNARKELESLVSNVQVHSGEGASGAEKRIAAKRRAEKDELEQDGPIPGGPVNETILKNFRKHIAFSIWSGEEDDRMPLKLHHHTSIFKDWDLSKEVVKVRDKLEATGLMQIVHSGQQYVDRTLISAMVERWHSETNTFHLPFGEMTITLDDVHHILGVPVVGKAVVGTCATTYLPNQEALLGRTVSDGNSLKLKTLKKQCAYRCNNESTDEEIDCSVRAYLLFMFGCIPFVNKTGGNVSVHLLECLEKVDEIKDYNWGAAILAWLYHHLGNASKRRCTQMSGYLNLLQVWIIEHLMVCRFIQRRDYIESNPKIFKWTASRVGGSKEGGVKALREDLDDLNQNQVCWDPYKNHRDIHPLQKVTFFKGCLLFYDVVEPYNPDRVLRQFGRIQLIPPKPTRPRILKCDRDLYKSLAEKLTKWPEHCLSEEYMGKKSNDDWKADPLYMDWFVNISHIAVQNPTFRIKHNSLDDDNLRDVDVDALSLTACHSKMLELCRFYPVPKGMIALVHQAQRQTERLYQQVEIRAKYRNERFANQGVSKEQEDDEEDDVSDNDVSEDDVSDDDEE